MDPISAIGLVSSAVSVAELAGTILVKLYKYYLDSKTADTSSAELRNEVGMVLSLLNAVIGSSDSLIHRLELVWAINGLQSVLTEIFQRVTPETTRGLGRLTWPFKKDENERLLSKLERYKSVFTLALNIEQRCIPQYSLVLTNRTHINEISDSIRAMKVTLQGRPRRYKPLNLDETERKALEWICPINAEDDQRSIVRLRSENTGLWLLQHQTYFNWVSAPKSFLWLYGQSTPS